MNDTANVTKLSNTQIAIPEFVSGMFTDYCSDWRQIGRHLYYGESGDKRYGVVLATMAPERDSYALNEVEFNRVLTGKVKGTIDAAFVVAAKLSSWGKPPEFQAAADIEVMAAKLAGRPTINSPRYGRFWGSLNVFDIDADAPF
jgi:hypothetical protein